MAGKAPGTKKDKTFYCPLEYGIHIIGGRWKSRIICILADKKVLRYGELQKEMAEITDAMLASALKDLIKEDIVERKQYGEIPPRVEYSLTPKGESLKPIIEDLIKWSLEQYKNNNMCGGTKDGK
jgi:DNA-binding HxlR family transcriptional regulator